MWLAAALSVVVAAFMVLTGYTAGEGPKPSLVVLSDEVVDLGDLDTGTLVTGTFRVANQGEAVLRIDPTPEVDVVEGC